MASKIQIKRGTGSAVPSGLLDGELAINLDNNKLYFGSGSTSVNKLALTELTADKAVITQLTSSIVSSSIIYSSGSNIFGDAVGDTHTFNGHITASGNISASLTSSAPHMISKLFMAIPGGHDYGLFNGSIDGTQRNIIADGTTAGFGLQLSNNFINKTTILGSKNIQLGTNSTTHVTASGNISASGTVYAEHLYSVDDAHIEDDLTVDGDIIGTSFRFNGTAAATSYISNGKFAVNDSSMTGGATFQVDGNSNLKGHITASDNISGSKTGTVSAGSGSYHILQGDTSQPTALFVDGHITSSGNISSSGTLLMGKPGVNVTHKFYGRIQTIGSTVTIGEGNITASGNIELGGTLSGSSTSTGSFAHIVTQGSTIEFKDGGTKLGSLKFDPTTGFKVEDANNNKSGITTHHITSSGNISSSGILRVGKPGERHEHYVYGRLNVIGSDISIGDGHISMSGNLIATGSITSDSNISAGTNGTGSFDHIITTGNTLEFKNKSSRATEGTLKFDTTNGLQLDNASGEKTQMKVGAVTSDNTGSFHYISATKNISSSGGTVITSKLKGSTTGDQSGSLYLSGSLTFRDNAAIPAVSASTLYNNNGHLYYGKGLIGGYHLSASADNVGYVKILPQDFVVADGGSSTTLYYNQGFEDDGSEFGIRNNTANLDIYAFKDIPAGWTATAFRTFGSSDDTVNFHVYDMSDGSRTADGNTGTLNGAETTLATPTLSDSVTYFGIHINVNSSADIVFGGYIKIERR